MKMASKLADIISLSLAIIAISAQYCEAQNMKPYSEKKTIHDMSMISARLSSWKCTGVVSESVTKHFTDKLKHTQEIIDEATKKASGVTPDPSRQIAYSYETPKVFFSCLRNSDILYSEQDATSNAIAAFPPPLPATLASIQKLGSSRINKDGKPYELNSGPDRKTLYEQNHTEYVDGSSISFHLLGKNITPLEAITRYRYKYTGQKEDPKFGALLAFTGKNPDNGDQINFYLAPKYDYRIVSCSSEGLGGKSSWVQEVKSMSQTKGHWLPDECEVKTFSFERGTLTLDITKTYKFLHKSVNDVEDELFMVKLSEGDIQRDMATGVVNVIGAKGKKLAIDTTSTPAKNIMGWGWLYMLSVTTLLIATVGAYVRWKRNQLSKQ